MGSAYKSPCESHRFGPVSPLCASTCTSPSALFGNIAAVRRHCLSFFSRVGSHSVVGDCQREPGRIVVVGDLGLRRVPHGLVPVGCHHQPVGAVWDISNVLRFGPCQKVCFGLPADEVLRVSSVLGGFLLLLTLSRLKFSHKNKNSVLPRGCVEFNHGPW